MHASVADVKWNAPIKNLRHYVLPITVRVRLHAARYAYAERGTR